MSLQQSLQQSMFLCSPDWPIFMACAGFAGAGAGAGWAAAAAAASINVIISILLSSNESVRGSGALWRGIGGLRSASMKDLHGNGVDGRPSDEHRRIAR